MNAINKNRIIKSLAVILLAGSNIQINAQPAVVLQAPLIFQVRATVQQPDTGTSPVVKSSTTTSRIATKDLINLIAKAQGTNLPSGARLVLKTVSTNHTFLILDKQWNLLLDASAAGYFSTGVYGTIVRRGRTNIVTGAQAYVTSYTYSNAFNDLNGTSIGINAIVQESYSWSALDRYGNRKVTDSSVLTGFGQGFVKGKAATFTEKITAMGRTTTGT
jgi:hypothetical protein